MRQRNRFYMRRRICPIRMSQRLHDHRVEYNTQVFAQPVRWFCHRIRWQRLASARQMSGHRQKRRQIEWLVQWPRNVSLSSGEEAAKTGPLRHQLWLRVEHSQYKLCMHTEQNEDALQVIWHLRLGRARYYIRIRRGFHSFAILSGLLWE